MTYIIQFKEAGEWKRTTYTCEEEVSYDYLIDFFGLTECEDYIIEEENDLPFTEGDTINWEHRRWITATLILSGMCSNYANPVTSSYLAESAVKLADALLKILADKSRPSLCSELYQIKDSKLSK